MKRFLAMTAASLAVLFFTSLSPAGQAAPSFQVDPLWPKPLPNHWLLGSVTGVAVDSRDHIWIVHRGYDSMTARTEIGAATNPKTSEECCVPAPPVLEFDTAGNLVSHWGGPGEKYDWPVSPGGIAVDSKGSVWITAAGPPEIPGSANATAGRGRGTAAAPGGASAAQGRAGGGAAEGGGTVAVTQAGRGGGGRANAPPKPQDAQVLKFSRTGDFLLQIGKAGTTGDNASTTALNRPAGVDVDPSGGEVYVADGFVNQRVVVFDAATGAYKRHWVGDGASALKTVSCAKVAKDGTVYVCDRGNNRVQAFDKNGKLLKQGGVSAETRGTGSVWDVALSRDPQQRYLYVADGHDQKIFILRRDTLETVGSFGDGGRYPGTFYAVGSIAVDSRGNIYTGENLEGKRLQKFMPKGAVR
jgi:DNA-binding beta-propeller fold protein YncE